MNIKTVTKITLIKKQYLGKAKSLHDEGNFKKLETYWRTELLYLV